MRNVHDLPDGLPVPVDDGAADHLREATLPDLRLPCTSGGHILLTALHGPTVLFFYPRTGVPHQQLGQGFDGEAWDEIPGARGCTPQSCAFRDVYADFRSLGTDVYGVSTQNSEFQRAFKEREHIPFDYLSDYELALAREMRLPTFEFPVGTGGPNTLIRRMSWFVQDGRIQNVWYPVFPPTRNAETVLAWVRARFSPTCQV